MGVGKIVRKRIGTKMRQTRLLRKSRANVFEQNAGKTIEQNSRKIIEQNVSERIDFKGYLNNMIQETNLLTTMLGKSITRNLMTGTSAQVPLST